MAAQRIALAAKSTPINYTDEAGVLLSQVVRYEPKDFRQRRPNGYGGWDWSVKGVRAVPYNLPRLLEAIGNEQIVYIAEGEKDCDRLGKLGLVASTNAGGAGKWRDELTPYFHNADVIVVADNDPQSRDKSGNLMFHDDGRPKFPGQDHAADVAAKLVAVANEFVYSISARCGRNAHQKETFPTGSTLIASMSLTQLSCTYRTGNHGQANRQQPETASHMVFRGRCFATATLRHMSRANG